MYLLAAVVLVLAAQKVECDFIHDGVHNEHGNHDEIYHDETFDYGHDGYWTEWSDWGPCSYECEMNGEENWQYRSRDCIMPPGGHGRPCEGETEDKIRCNRFPCERQSDAYWSNWSDWSPCTNDCEVNGKKNWKYKTRTCIYPPYAYSGKDCKGHKKVKARCNKFPCQEYQLHAYWSEWSDWGQCSNECEEHGKKNWKYRTRVCHIPPHSYSGKPCKGRKKSRARCNRIPCYGHGDDAHWTKWSKWSKCSDVCEKDGKKNYKYKTRECITPPHSYSGRPCKGRKRRRRRCNKIPCHDQGQWTAWSEWGPCSHGCEKNGEKNFRYRSRACSSNGYGEAKCNGRKKGRKRCNKHPCYEDLHGY